MKKVLLTGPDGLLGSNLVRRLLDGGYGVRALVHPASRSTTLDGLEIERIKGDILDPSPLKDAVKDCDAVFHVAASTAMWPPRDPKITAVNVEGTRNVLDAARSCGVARLVHVGSASSFGYGTKAEPGTESSPYLYRDFRLAYFESKLEAQEMVLRAAGEGSIDAVVVNPTFMIGPHDFGPSSGMLIVKFVKLRPVVFPPGGRNFVDVRDVADAMIAALEKGRTGECYLLGHRNLEMRELFTLLARMTGGKPPKIPLSKSALLLAGRIGSIVAAITKRPPDLSYEIARNACTGAYYSADKAVRELGLRQRPIEETLEDAYRWFVDKGYIA